jgi:hypothetical protein
LQKSEEITMRYTAPSIITATGATQAIQSGIVKGSSFQDNLDPSQGMNATVPAYEADE